MVGQQAKHVEVILESPLTIYLLLIIYIEYGLRDGWFVATLYAPRLLSAMRPCLYPSVETVESILQRAPPELTTAGRTETKPWWEEDRPEPSPIAPAPKPKPADQDNVSRPPSTAVLLSEQSPEQTNPSDAVTMRLVHKTYEDANT